MWQIHNEWIAVEEMEIERLYFRIHVAMNLSLILDYMTVHVANIQLDFRSKISEIVRLL